MTENIGEIVCCLCAELRPLLAECGIQIHDLQTARIKTLEKIISELKQFRDSDAVAIFQRARQLRAPGVLQQWAKDEMTREAREVQVYIKARSLVRQVWRESVTTRRHLRKQEQPHAPTRSSS